MKYPFIQKSYEFHRFNERTNEIEFDRAITATRRMTLSEKREYKQVYKAYIICSTLTWLCIIAMLTCIILAATILPTWVVGLALLWILIMDIPLRFVLQYGDDKENMVNHFLPQRGFEEEDAAWESAEAYVHDCADAWRATHPLEEKIRVAQESGNCVDIAELVQYCGANIVNKISERG